MNFYAQQASKRWQSFVLLVAFVLVLILMAGIIHVVITALSLALGQEGSFMQPGKPAIAMIVLVWLTMIAGSIFRVLDIRAGGAVLARRFGAVRASDRSRHVKERQLLNIVAEVAIASNSTQPDVYVLRHEQSINAFVLGNHNSRPVIVVTEGALESFDRDELMAVVAHEFAHIANGDLALNMRLLVVMGGLLAIDEVGQLLIAKDMTDQFHPGKIIGYVVCSLGKIGVFAGQVISAAFSRQREFLADATAIQFTRHPFALASALDVLEQHQYEPALHGVHARELAHLCFQSGKVKRWLTKLMATHPDLSQRINAVEPHFQVKKRKSNVRTLAEAVSGYAGQTANALSIACRDELPGESAMALTSRSPVAISDRILLLLPDESLCLAALFAVFVDTDSNKRRDYLNALGFSFDDLFVARVKSVMQLLPDELKKDQVGVISHVTGVLCDKLNTEQRQKITLKLEQLLGVGGHYHLMDYARVQLIRRKLDVEFPVVSALAGVGASQATARKVKNFDAMGREFALLLSLMVETSGASAGELDEQFQRVLKCYTLEKYPRRTANETGIIDELEAAFQTLYVQPQSIRHAFVHHCVEIMRHDGRIMPSERALLNLFAASLGCEELIAA